jgi:hypothetical protein
MDEHNGYEEERKFEKKINQRQNSWFNHRNLHPRTNTHSMIPLFADLVLLFAGLFFDCHLSVIQPPFDLSDGLLTVQWFKL